MLAALFNMRPNNSFYFSFLNCFGVLEFLWYDYLGWVVQRWAQFNPGLSKNYSSNGFFKENVMLLIKYCSDLSRKNPFNPKFTDQSCLYKGGNKSMD